MKKFIFLIALFSLTFMSAIASDVGKQANDMLQNSYVVQQISTVPVINAVNFETAQVVYNFTSTILMAKTETEVQTWNLDTWRNPDWGPRIASSKNMNIKNQTYNHSNNNSYTPYLLLTACYSLSTTNYLPTARHV